MEEIEQRDWSYALAWEGPPPGGGSAAAVGAALAAGLLALLLRSRGEDPEPAEALRLRLQDLAWADEKALREVLGGFSGGGQPAEAQVEAALAVPLALVEAAGEGLSLAQSLVPRLPQHLRCDLEVALWQLAAALRGGAAIADLNLSLAPQACWQEACRRQLAAGRQRGEAQLASLQAALRG